MLDETRNAPMTQIIEVERIIEDASVDQLPNIIGALSRLQAVAHVRLLSLGRPARDIDQLLTVPQVAKQVQLSEYRIYELIRQGELKSVRLGKSVRVRPSALADFVAQQGGC